MIPQTLHYCWFGGSPKPQLVLDCIASWRRFMPDWNIMEWNESNYDVRKCQYSREAHAAKLWAFVSDYARFDILWTYGGIYMDTDVELLKPIPDWVLKDDAFTGAEASGMVSPGLVFGSVPGLPFVRDVKDSYEDAGFTSTKASRPETVNQRVTALLEQAGYLPNEVVQTVRNITIYPAEYFCGYDQDVHQPKVTENTVSRHHYAHSWGSKADARRVVLQRAIMRVVGESSYRAVLKFKRRLLGVRGS